MLKWLVGMLGVESTTSYGRVDEMICAVKLDKCAITIYMCFKYWK